MQCSRFDVLVVQCGFAIRGGWYPGYAEKHQFMGIYLDTSHHQKSASSSSSSTEVIYSSQGRSFKQSHDGAEGREGKQHH